MNDSLQLETFEDAIEAIMQYDRLPREEVIALSNKEYIRYLRILRMKHHTNHLKE